jgi:hypothetical protein
MSKEFSVTDLDPTPDPESDPDPGSDPATLVSASRKLRGNYTNVFEGNFFGKKRFFLF